MTTHPDKVFGGSIPKVYEQCLVPMIFEPYATDLVQRLHLPSVAQVLELAAGTGVVTRALAAKLPAQVSIIATDLNAAMLEQAAATGTPRAVKWQQADAMQLPFADARFDAVVCQFGVMFFPDKTAAFAEVRRVLKPGGVYLFNVWDRIEENEVADTVTRALAEVFPEDPPRFMARTPHGYHRIPDIERDLIAAGFTAPRITTLAARSRAASAEVAALAYCQGTPLRNEIESRDAGALAMATAAAARAIATRFGDGVIDAKIQAHIVALCR